MTSKVKFYLLKNLVITESKQYKLNCELHDLEKHEHISIQDCVNDIEKDLDNITKFYNAITQKRDNAQNDYTTYIIYGHELIGTKSYNEIIQVQKELSGQLKAYNDVLSLMESMFEVKEDGK